MSQSRFPARRESTGTPWAFGNWSDLMNRFMLPSFFEPMMTTGTVAPVDVCERDNEFVIRMACAGCRPQDVEVTVENDTVRIRGRFPEHGEFGSREQQGTTQQFQGQQNWQQGQGPQNWQPGGQPGQTWQGQQGQPGQTTAKGEQCLIRELPTGRFERDITLPTAVSAQQARASFDNGLLTLFLPKTQAAQGHRIQIGQGTGMQQGAGTGAH